MISVVRTLFWVLTKDIASFVACKLSKFFKYFPAKKPNLPNAKNQNNDHKIIDRSMKNDKGFDAKEDLNNHLVSVHYFKILKNLKGKTNINVIL